MTTPTTTEQHHVLGSGASCGRGVRACTRAAVRYARTTKPRLAMAVPGSVIFGTWNHHPRRLVGFVT